jgi:glyoxylase-like metal-dependent hydrolase (beta-lactamase superfamily II)
MSMPPISNFSRRSFLGRSLISLGALAGTAGAVLAQEASSPAVPPARNPFVYHFKIGEIDAWSISDGHLLFKDPLNLMWPEEARPAMRTWLENHSERTDGIPLYINILVIRSGREIAIFDGGFGPRSNPDLGWVAAGLQQIGIAPNQITAAFLSHAHADHLGGFVLDGKPAFSNAAFHFLPEEHAFWHGEKPDFSKSKRNKAELPGMIHTIRSQFEILKPNSQPLKPGTQLLNGAVTIEAAPGHTAGHAIFRIRSGKEELLHLMDLAHHHGLMFHNPDWNIAFDHDPQQAIATRRRIFADAAARKTRCYGFHIPWPGLGRVLPLDSAYLWSPERWSWGS